MVHALKIKPKYFELVNSERKLFEVRKKDRCYAVDDYLALNEYDDLKEIYTGACLLVKVTSILDDEKYCKEGYVVLGIKKIQLKDSDFETYGGMVISKERKSSEVKDDKWIDAHHRLPIEEFNRWNKSSDADFEVIVQMTEDSPATTVFFYAEDEEYYFYDIDCNDDIIYYDPLYWQPLPDPKGGKGDA